MKYRVFVDGQEGTTGLMILERLEKHPHVELLSIDPEKRKDKRAREELLNEAELSFLCLPDEASRESVSLVRNPRARIIDASTAFRTDPDWAYGIPELSVEHREKIEKSNRVTVAGCYPTGFNLIAYPLVARGIASVAYPFTVNAISGYSGGGKKLINRFESGEIRNPNAPRYYGLNQTHKHLPEMKYVPGLLSEPIFNPIVCNYYKGMVVSVPMYRRLLDKAMGSSELRDFFASYFASSRFIRVMPYGEEGVLEAGFLDPLACNDTNRADLFVFGNDERSVVVCRIDNLGKGSSGAAVQCMNIMLSLDEGIGLEA